MEWVRKSSDKKIAERRQNFADSEMSGNEEKLRSQGKFGVFADQQQWGFNEPRALFRFALSAQCHSLPLKIMNQFAYLWKFTWFPLFILELLVRVTKLSIYIVKFLDTEENISLNKRINCVEESRDFNKKIFYNLRLNEQINK